MPAHSVLDDKTRAQIKRLAAGGRHTDTEIGRKVGVSARTVRRALEPTSAAKAHGKGAAVSAQERADDDEQEGPAIDCSAPPLEVARALLQQATGAIAKLKVDSPRLNPTRTLALNLTKFVDALEAREAAGKETAEELEQRRRREDGETRREIEVYVQQAEAEAHARGVCITCGQGVPR